MKCIKLTLIALLTSANLGSATLNGTDYLPFSEANLISLMNSIGIAHADIVLAQAKLETGNFTSKVFIENNNLFGMRLAKQRETTAIGEQYNHAMYGGWKQSVMDYKLWQDRYAHRCKSKKAYLRYLSKNYAEDKQYINKLKQML